MRIIGWLVLMVALGTFPGGVTPAVAADAADQEEIGATPPRLSLVEGRVSFWRPGAEDWVEAQINTPLAPGDELATAAPGSIEVQIGARAFLRAGAETQVGLEDQEPDFLQVKVTGGGVALDLREMEAGQSVEVNTPNAAFTIEHAGYYRVDVLGDRTSFITRRGGRATATPASGPAVAIAPSTQAIIEGTDDPRVTTHSAPRSDDWDRWNYARSKELLQPQSARYVPPGTYGVGDLDRHGTWRTVPTYGAVWMPARVPPDWAPYTTGAWVLDPIYGWTWVDTAPWGWAPYHYGRWVYVDGYWGWAPGPIARRAVYAPALVAFLGGVTVSVGVGPTVGWVALGWGEPLVPWWGRPGFAHVPSWRGWGGPRVVNNVVVTRTTVVTSQHITVYRNTHVRNAVVVVKDTHFGRGRIDASARIAHVDRAALRPVHTGPHVAPSAASRAPSTSRGIRPPDEHVNRRVVATRPPREVSPGHDAHESRPKPHIVSAPERGESRKATTSTRSAPIERATTGGSRPASPPVAHQGRGTQGQVEQATPSGRIPASEDRHGRASGPSRSGQGTPEAAKAPAGGTPKSPSSSSVAPATSRTQPAVTPSPHAKPEVQPQPPAAHQGPPAVSRERRDTATPATPQIHRQAPPQPDRGAGQQVHQPAARRSEPKPQEDEGRRGNGGHDRGKDRSDQDDKRHGNGGERGRDRGR